MFVDQWLWVKKKIYGEEMATNSFIKVVKANEINNPVVQTLEHVILILTAIEIYCLSMTDWVFMMYKNVVQRLMGACVLF
jgi:hypothetical protein